MFLDADLDARRPLPPCFRRAHPGQLLDRLPLKVLAAVQLHEATLARLGCRTLGDVRRLPRGGLSRRFDKALLLALDRAYGLQPEAHSWIEVPATFEARLELLSRVEMAPALLFGARRLLLISGILAAVGTAVVILSRGMPMMMVGGALVGLATGAFFTSNWALGTSIVPREEAGRWLGISNLAGAGAGAIGAYIGGPIGDGAGYLLLMGLYGILFLFSTLALIKIKPEAGA